MALFSVLNKITLQFWYSWQIITAEGFQFSDYFWMGAVDLKYCKKYIVIFKIQIASSHGRLLVHS